MSSFLTRQKNLLLELKDRLLDTNLGIGKDQLHSRPEGGEASGTGQHMADAGSDACDRDFALSVLSKNSSALLEIDEALARIEAGTYGICELSGEKIPKERLEALPFTRYTVGSQSQLEKNGHFRRAPQQEMALFGNSEDGDEEETEETP